MHRKFTLLFLGMSAGCWLYYHPLEREASPRLFPSFDAVLCVLSL